MTPTDLKALSLDQLQTLLRWLGDGPIFATFCEQVKAEIASRS